MDMTEEENRLLLENKKLAREIRRLNQDIALLRAANEQALYTQANIQKGKDRQVFYIEQVMETSPSILILTDDKLRTVIASDIYYQYSDAYGKSEVQSGIPLRCALAGILAEPELDAFSAKCRRSLEGKNVKPYIVRGVHQDGKQRWRVIIRRMTRDDAAGLCVILSDTTEIVDAMERAKAADRAKSSFVANMSHEIRTPINAMLGLNEMILRESREPDTLGYAADIQTAGRTLLSLVNDILDFSKVEEGRMEIIPVQYELSSLIGDLVNMTRTRAGEKGLEFRLEVQKDIPNLLFGDEIRIRQCVLNILTNAVKYTLRGSVTLSVSAVAADDGDISLRFCVTDTGIGLKSEDIEKLFMPFTRIEEKRNRFVEGTGLGMTITKQLLSLMGSELKVESVYGSGSTFSFALNQRVIDRTPARDYTGSMEHSPAQISAYRALFRAPEARILVVDDMPLNLTVVKGLLKKTEIAIDTAASGGEAIEKAAARKYDVIFVDHMMPGMDGIETLRELKKLPGTEDTVYIALTANAVSGSRERYLEAGFSDYLSKPMNSERLEEMLRTCLPREKVLAPSAERAAEERAALPEQLRGIQGLDIRAGLRFCGTEENYLNTLADFAAASGELADAIDAYFRAGDLRNAVIKIHAVKSAAYAIGANALGALAERLESAGKNGDAEAVGAGLGELSESYRALGRRLAPIAARQSGPRGDAREVSPEQLSELYGTLRALMGDYEFDSAAALIGSFSGIIPPEGERERVDALMRAAEDFEWERVNALLEK